MLKSVRQQNDVNELSLHCKLWTDLSHCRLWMSKFRLGCNHGKDSLAFWPLFNKNEVHCVCPFLVSYAKSDILVNTSDTSILSYFASLFFVPYLIEISHFPGSFTRELYSVIKLIIILTYFWPMCPFYTPWKYQKSGYKSGVFFWVNWGCKSEHWSDMG